MELDSVSNDYSNSILTYDNNRFNKRFKKKNRSKKGRNEKIEFIRLYIVSIVNKCQL